MTDDTPSSHHLVAQIDQMITVFGPQDPQLKRQLEAFRAEFQALLKERRRADAAKAALQFASWIKFFFDHF